MHFSNQDFLNIDFFVVWLHHSSPGNQHLRQTIDYYFNYSLRRFAQKDFHPHRFIQSVHHPFHLDYCMQLANN